MRIIGCVNAYQDRELLEQSLPALRNVVDLLVVVDGAYREFPWYGGTPVSTDGSLELARRLANIVIECPVSCDGSRRVPWIDEVKKRNAYMIGEPGDYYLVVDADEIVEGSIDRAHVCARDDWGVEIYREEDSRHAYPIHRLFKHRQGIEYRGTHHAVHVGKILLHPDKVVDVKANTFPGLRLRHAQYRRPIERSERKGVYYRQLFENERRFREACGL